MLKFPEILVCMIIQMDLSKPGLSLIPLVRWKSFCDHARGQQE